MPTSTDELLRAKESAQDLLESCCVAAYVFEVEPRDDQWELRVDCAVDGGWQSINLLIDRKDLLQSPEDTSIRDGLMLMLRERLAACKKAPNAD